MSGNTLQIGISQYSDAGRKARNDDSHGVVVPKGHLLTTKGVAVAIADGMSSSEAAKEASECCVRSFLDDYYATHESWTVKKSVATVLKATNSWLYAQGQRLDFEGRGMVSTFSGVVLKSGSAHLFHVGDSRVWRFRNGCLEQLTSDHRVKLAGGLEHLSRSFGINHNLEIDYRQEYLEDGDVYLLTTDGVHDALSPTDISRLLLAAHDDFTDIAKQISECAFKNGSLDNLTCQAIHVCNAGNVDADGYSAAAARLSFPKPLMPGDTLDTFTIIRALHESSRSQVYLATDPLSNETVVIKTPSLNYHDDPAYIEAFAHEEWVGRMVASPNTLRFFPSTGHRRFLYHVTEFFDGKTLQQWMHDNPHAELEMVRTIVEQIATGLRALHRKDILHLDLKPGNVMINAKGLVKIIDFGSCRAANWNEGNLHRNNGPAGTADYTAPENVRGDEATNRSDIFSLAAITYEMLTGHLPYGKGIDAVAGIKKLRYIPAATTRKDVPGWMDAALENAVHLDPAKRTDALSAFTTNLRKPNPALVPARHRPLIERDPVLLWRTLSFALFALCVVLAYLLKRYA
jgi:eukaryotic-like serine/threonine-protein kinase